MWVSVIGVTLAGSATGIIIYSEWRLAKLVPGGLGERFPTKVYSAPFMVSDAVPLEQNQLMKRLTALDYHVSNADPLIPGQYRSNNDQITISLRGYKTPVSNQEPLTVVVKKKSDSRWDIESSTGAKLSEFKLEPELVAELSGPQKVRRDPASWNDFPSALTDAVITVEDRRFYKHIGIDLRAIFRAAWFNLRHRKNLQGGSTITQQLVKNFFLTQERTMQRKFLEAAFALYLDLRIPKERILTLYLNEIYMGQDGVVSIAGMKAASHFYFGKELNELDVAECALLAGIIRSPFRYNPFQNPIAAKNRRDTVLRLMFEEGVMIEPDYEKWRATPVLTRKRRTAQPGMTVNDHDYFVAEVLRQLIPHFSEDVLFRYGLKIFTTMDPMLQRFAQQAVQREKKQAALIALDPSNGHVWALIGGKDFRESQFNRATQARRQPGSVFKPFVYGAALQNGFTPATILQDEPRAYRDGKRVWFPQNFDNVYRGPVPLRDALAKSINGATLDLIQKIGSSTVIEFARKLGIESPLENSLALALGVSEVTPIEITRAYATFANGGFSVEPLLVTAVADSEDNVLELNGTEREQVIEPALSYVMTSILESTVLDGTAKGLKAMGWDGPAAGKTGTTNSGKDAWFIGYTPAILVGVWVGDDEAKAAQLSGAKNALPIWADFMKRAFPTGSKENFEMPSGVVSIRIDPASGLLARSGCPDQKEEMFVTGTEPKAYCGLHAGGLRGWLLKLFQKKPAPASKEKPETEVQD